MQSTLPKCAVYSLSLPQTPSCVIGTLAATRIASCCKSRNKEKSERFNKKNIQGRPDLEAMSDYSASPSDHHSEIQAPKRKATQAGLDGHATGRSVKRRASKACQCCRARKVRCNVTEHGAPCTNCRLDEVECIVSESRRKKSVPHSRTKSGVVSTLQTALLFDQRFLDMPSSSRVGRGSAVVN